MRGQKHLVACRCVLPQYKSRKDPYVHKFIVFSTIKDDDSTVVKYAQCNNCGVIHRVTGICTSEIMSGKEHMTSLMSIDEVKTSISKNIANILEANSADLSTWEAVQFIIENKKWGEFVVLTTETEGEETIGKYISILGEALCKVDTFTRTGVI